MTKEKEENLILVTAIWKMLDDGIGEIKALKKDIRDMVKVYVKFNQMQAYTKGDNKKVKSIQKYLDQLDEIG